MATETKCLAAFDNSGEMRAHVITRRAIRPNDVKIAILYAGICHSDLHTIRSDWGPTIYPVVPGHEIAGVVEEVGAEVTGFEVGQKVGVGCMVNSCLNCGACQEGEEQYCHSGTIFTYNSLDAYGDNDPTYGGYSTHIVVRQEFVCHIPDPLELPVAAPLLCAGITLFSPIKRHVGLEGGKTLGIVGFGGLGHMGLKIAKTCGHRVVILSTSERKREKAMSMGADDFLIVNDETAIMPEHQRMCDVIIDTASEIHKLPNYFPLLKHRGDYVLLGAPKEPHSIHFFNLCGVNLCNSLIGGMEETREMLNFCAEHNVTPDIELIEASQVNEALEALTWNSNPKNRFVIDVVNTMDGGEVKPYPSNPRCQCESCSCGNVCLCTGHSCGQASQESKEA